VDMLWGPETGNNLSPDPSSCPQPRLLPQTLEPGGRLLGFTLSSEMKVTVVQAV